MRKEDIVKNCWIKIEESKGVEFFVSHFYQNFFKANPETRRFFPENIEAQQASLLGMLDGVINGIEFLDDLKPELKDLGERHKSMGIKDKMFDAFVESITDSANVASNNSLNVEELDAWKNAFNKISSVMLKSS